MTKIDQNFELPEPYTASINSTLEAKRPNTPIWKRLVIVIPALIFFILLASIIALSSGNKTHSSISLTPTPPQTPEAVPTPHISEIDRLINLKASLDKLDIDQKEIQPPVLDLRIKF